MHHFPKKIVPILALLFSFLLGCGARVTQVIEGSNCEPAPPSSEIIEHDFVQSKLIHITCYEWAEDGRDACYKNGGDYGKCQGEYDIEIHRCDYYMALARNKSAIRECDARIYVIPEGVKPEEYQLMVDESDTDGDGIVNWREAYMGYNMCSPTSFGFCEGDGQVWADADLDYDADGKPNGTDDDEVCNWNDPAGYQTDCI